MNCTIILGVLAAVFVAGTADAHPHLTDASPSANTLVSAPDIIRLTYSERIIPKLSRLTLTSADGKPVKLVGATVGAGGKQLLAKPLVHLKPGRYIVDWTAVSVDSHRVVGKSKFTVKQ